MPDHVSPSVQRRRLAAELRRLREEQNLTGEEVADALRWSGSKISRIETSRTGVKSGDLSKLLELYGVPADHRQELVALAREPRRKGWWEAYTDVLLEQYAAYIMLESDAAAIFCWSPEIIHGLLQTEDYAKAVTKAHGTEYDPPGEVARRIQARLRRQGILTREDPPEVTFVLDESVLIRRQADNTVMRGQLAHLIQIAGLPNVKLHILPLAGTHPVGAGGGFALMQFPPVPGIGPAPDVVYVEQLAKSVLYVEDEAETHQYRLAAGRLTAESLDVAGSRDLIADINRTIWS
jgi:transcriptional regulator with XRE-family HTH domain